MKKNLLNINEAPIDKINLLEKETFQYKPIIDNVFLLKFDGMAIISPTYIGHIYASVCFDQADIISFLIKKILEEKVLGVFYLKNFYKNFAKKALNLYF